MLDVSTNEVYTYSKAMKEPDSEAFITAMLKEIHDHEENNHWEIVERLSMPEGTKTI